MSSSIAIAAAPAGAATAASPGAFGRPEPSACGGAPPGGGAASECGGGTTGGDLGAALSEVLALRCQLSGLEGALSQLRAPPPRRGASPRPLTPGGAGCSHGAAGRLLGARRSAPAAAAGRCGASAAAGSVESSGTGPRGRRPPHQTPHAEQRPGTAAWAGTAPPGGAPAPGPDRDHIAPAPAHRIMSEASVEEFLKAPVAALAARAPAPPRGPAPVGREEALALEARLGALLPLGAALALQARYAPPPPGAGAPWGPGCRGVSTAGEGGRGPASSGDTADGGGRGVPPLPAAASPQLAEAFVALDLLMRDAALQVGRGRPAGAQRRGLNRRAVVASWAPGVCWG